MRFFVAGLFTFPSRTLFIGIVGASEKKGRFCECADGDCGRTGAFPWKRRAARERIVQALSRTRVLISRAGFTGACFVIPGLFPQNPNGLFRRLPGSDRRTGEPDDFSNPNADYGNRSHGLCFHIMLYMHICYKHMGDDRVRFINERAFPP